MNVILILFLQIHTDANPTSTDAPTRNAFLKRGDATEMTIAATTPTKRIVPPVHLGRSAPTTSSLAIPTTNAFLRATIVTLNATVSMAVTKSDAVSTQKLRSVLTVLESRS